MFKTIENQGRTKLLNLTSWISSLETVWIVWGIYHFWIGILDGRTFIEVLLCYYNLFATKKSNGLMHYLMRWNQWSNLEIFSFSENRLGFVCQTEFFCIIYDWILTWSWYWFIVHTKKSRCVNFEIFPSMINYVLKRRNRMRSNIATVLSLLEKLHCLKACITFGCFKSIF